MVEVLVEELVMVEVVVVVDLVLVMEDREVTVMVDMQEVEIQVWEVDMGIQVDLEVLEVEAHPSAHHLAPVKVDLEVDLEADMEVKTCNLTHDTKIFYYDLPLQHKRTTYVDTIRYGDGGDGCSTCDVGNVLLARLGGGDDDAPVVGGSGTSTGKGVFSSSSSAIDSTGKIAYSAHAGKL
uniref:(California timema) hypothetical protein n=1 Tax=Timema californicum TaxID=61474 RepID=A0A7R9J3N3_TIMCA|nr:unnamed protein product [Timema californicum]